MPQAASDKKLQPGDRICPKCDSAIPVNRGVCAQCGHKTPWFKIRLYVGCASVLIAGLGILAMLIAAILQGPPAAP